jgi:hypothetical protein
MVSMWNAIKMDYVRERYVSKVAYLYIRTRISAPDISVTTAAGWHLTSCRLFFSFHSCTVHLDTIKVFYLPTDEQ